MTQVTDWRLYRDDDPPGQPSYRPGLPIDLLVQNYVIPDQDWCLAALRHNLGPDIKLGFSLPSDHDPSRCTFYAHSPLGLIEVFEIPRTMTLSTFEGISMAWTAVRRGLEEVR